MRGACEAAGIELVLLATPTTPRARMSAIAAASQGFVYLVSVTGVTGMKEQVGGGAGARRGATRSRSTQCQPRDRGSEAEGVARAPSGLWSGRLLGGCRLAAGVSVSWARQVVTSACRARRVRAARWSRVWRGWLSPSRP